jgi:ATP-dependent helicase/DNAse subunit B
VLKLESWVEEEPMEGMDPLLRGQIIHAILEGFLRDYPGDAWPGTPMPALLEALARRASRMLEEGRPAAVPDLLWEIERDRLLQTLANWLAYEKQRPDPELRPMHLERAFGSFPGEADVPAYGLQAGKIGFAFRGRIDRIDMSHDGRRARVIDYKTGPLPQTMRGTGRTLLMAGERIQLAIYSGALSVMTDLADLRQVAAEYLHLQSGNASIDACVYSNDELNAAIERLPWMLEVFQEGVTGGVFFARARGSVRPYGHCDYCDFLRICGKDREQRERHKSGDPAVARFARFREIDGGAEAEP